MLASTVLTINGIVPDIVTTSYQIRRRHCTLGVEGIVPGLSKGLYPPRQERSALVEGIDIDLTERVTTPQQLRDQGAYMFAAGRSRWTVFARHIQSGELAGFTEISRIQENRGGSILNQGESDVLPKHRGHGLGLRMKAIMVRAVLAVLQGIAGAKRIRTTNANLNEPMLRINQRLGFRPTWTDREWQVRIDSVQSCLDRPQKR